MKFFHDLLKHRDLGLLFLRLGVGVTFLYHGVMKWSLWSAAAGDPSGANMLNLMKFLSIVEPLGGLALILGVLTQLASLGLAVVMLGAIYFKMAVWKFAFAEAAKTGWELDFILLAACLCLLLVGAGKYALDKKHE